MLQYCKMRVVQVIETVRNGSFKGLLRETVYLNREAVPVEIDLSKLRPTADFPRPSGEEIVELTPDVLSRRSLSYPVRSRELKTSDYLKRGYRGYAVVRENEVAGDIWCADATAARDGRNHPDESWLGIRCRDGEVYTFDMFVAPGNRGGNIAAALQNGALHELKKQGFTKAYGFFWSDNVPALWVHRTLRWRELTRVRVSRLLLSRKLFLKRKPLPGPKPD
ncbi:MAG TPA: GCN5 family acetyltransferase [Geobacter sp.]|nr:GCN5 family acetyltransferase [Geobacter sp.]